MILVLGLKRGLFELDFWRKKLYIRIDDMNKVEDG